MSGDKLALKRLTASDLTLFETQFRKLGAGNQKAINLNRDVFVSDLYPGVAALPDTVFPLSMSIFGPSGKGAHLISRKIIKNPSYKNWRLNGEFIKDPEDDPTRYDELAPSDLAVLSFEGEGDAPTALTMTLLSQNSSDDAALHAVLIPLMGNRSMIPLSRDNIADAIITAGPGMEHPLQRLILDPAIESEMEDAAQGGLEGITALRQRRRGRAVSRSDLAKAKQNASDTGRAGAGLVSAHLFEQREAGNIADWLWDANENAISAFDFSFEENGGQKVKVEVKSTKGEFNNRIHISTAELLEAENSDARYDLYRVYDMEEDGAKLKISENMGPFAKMLLDTINLPDGITCDSFSFKPDSQGLNWSDDISISAIDDVS